MSEFYLRDKAEQRVYDSAGGGEKGEQAVLCRRQYLQDYYQVESQYARERKAMLFAPKNEKPTATLNMPEDDYDE